MLFCSGVTVKKIARMDTTSLPTARLAFVRPATSSARTTTAPWPPPSATASMTAETHQVSTFESWAEHSESHVKIEPFVKTVIKMH